MSNSSLQQYLRRIQILIQRFRIAYLKVRKEQLLKKKKYIKQYTKQYFTIYIFLLLRCKNNPIDYSCVNCKTKMTKMMIFDLVKNIFCRYYLINQ